MPKSRTTARPEISDAAGQTLPDILAPGLRVLFCGINPGLYSARVGHHFARPGNRFWPTLYAAGFTTHRLIPAQEHELLTYGYGLTNLVARATASAAELTTAELIAGGRRLLAKVQQYQPQIVAILGVSAYRTAFSRPLAGIGRQSERLGSTALWVLPSPSGLNAHYTPTTLAQCFRELHCALEIAAE
ncbi:MAG: G/U mismatch-specific DNA glycosylase [Candidatus Competibacteraceae bacterium]